MAERRMFAKTIIDSDAFLDMPLSTQALYFHLSMRADDEGFINNPKKIMRMIGANQNEMELLLAKRYLLMFDSGVVVIKHWKIHNYIQKDRFKETLYKEEREQVSVKVNNSYTDTVKGITDDVSNMYPESVQDGDTGKVSIELGKSKVNNKAKSSRFSKPTLSDLETFCKDNDIKIDCSYFINYYDSNGWMIGRGKMKDWKATVRNWGIRDKTYQKPAKQDNFKTGGVNFEL